MYGPSRGQRLDFKKVGASRVGPKTSRTRGRSKADSIVARLTDTSKYTGAHKHRFDKEGRGRGLAGRDMGNAGVVSSISQIMRPGLNKGAGGLIGGGPKTSRYHYSRADSSGDRPRGVTRKRRVYNSNQSVLDRLTNPKNFTGAHRQRFDKQGRGRGLAGRDMGNEGKISDLSQITRSNLSQRQAAKKGYKPSRMARSDLRKPVQLGRVKRIWVFQNGDKHHKAVSVPLDRGINHWDKLLKVITGKLTIPTGACKHLYLVDSVKKDFKRVPKNLTKLVDGASYLATGPEPINISKLPLAVFSLYDPAQQ